MKPSDWRMVEKCVTCPFHTKGPGRALARSLRRGRMDQIRRDLRAGLVFQCHKTTTDQETDDDGNFTPTAATRLCAGALEYQAKVGVSSQLQRICERLER
jgi:hypothetical protein